MGKVCLLLVLSIVFVFSTSAQPNLKSADISDTIIDVKVAPEATETKNELVRITDNITEVKTPVKTAESSKKTIEASDKTAATDKAEVKPNDSNAAGKQSSSASVFRMFENTSLGTFTTGDATIDSYIEAACARYNVDPLLIYAQMNQESSFKLKATSNKGASGLMQLMPATALRFGVRNIYNPKQNIEAGVKYMRWLLDKFGGDVRLALAGYNAGEGSVMKYGNRIPPYRETRSYVARITAHYQQISNQISVPADVTNKDVDEKMAKAY
jgi:soluble lytic murein transglycosylase-like protein